MTDGVLIRTADERIAARAARAERDRRRWSEALAGGRLLRFFLTDPKYAHISASNRDAYVRDIIRTRHHEQER